MCDVDPRLAGGDGLLPIPGQPAASPEPGEGALDNPSPGQEFEPLRGVRALYDLDGPIADPVQCAAQFRSGIAAVGEDMAQPGAGMTDGFQNPWRAIPVLDVGGMNDQPEQQSDGVDDDMAFASLELLACVKA